MPLHIKRNNVQELKNKNQWRGQTGARGPHPPPEEIFKKCGFSDTELD